MCTGFLSEHLCCEPLTVRGWITAIFSYPISQTIQKPHPFKSFVSAKHLLLPPLHLWGGFYSCLPLISAPSSAACFSALFFRPRGEFLQSLIFSKLLSSGILSVPRASPHFLLRFITISPKSPEDCLLALLSKPGHHRFIFISTVPVYIILPFGLTCAVGFSGTSKHVASLNYELRSHTNLMN